MPNPRKLKGDEYERQISKYINFHTGLNSSRAPLSGGGAQFKVGNDTAGSADILGVPYIWPECKRTERFEPYKAMAQAMRGVAAKKNGEFPTVFTRRNYMDTDHSLVVMLLKDWMQLYKAFLTLNPHQTITHIPQDDLPPPSQP